MNERKQQSLLTPLNHALSLDFEYSESATVMKGTSNFSSTRKIKIRIMIKLIIPKS